MTPHYGNIQSPRDCAAHSIREASAVGLRQTVGNERPRLSALRIRMLFSTGLDRVRGAAISPVQVRAPVQ